MPVELMDISLMDNNKEQIQDCIFTLWNYEIGVAKCRNERMIFLFLSCSIADYLNWNSSKIEKIFYDKGASDVYVSLQDTVANSYYKILLEM